MPTVFEDVFAGAPIGTAVVDRSGRVVHVNSALCGVIGYSALEICGRPFSALSDPRHVDVDGRQMSELLGGQIGAYHAEKRYQHAQGHYVWVLESVSLVRDRPGRPRHLVVQVQDISERKELEGQLEYLVDHDRLTDLFNGRRFEQALVQATGTAARYGGGGAVLLVDLDHFKSVNDQFGHKAGDDLLRAVAATLRGRVRETDVLARLGGDEFGIVLPRVSARQAEECAASIVKALRRRSAMHAGQHHAVTVSVGVATLEGHTNVEALAAADLAMYEAKEAGGDQFAVYRPRQDGPPQGSSRLAEVERIQRALAHDQLELQCQPILDLATGEVEQYELLLRLRTDDGQLLHPSAFLHVAERFGRLSAIDAWVVRRAGAIIARQVQAGRPVRLSVNISATSMGDVVLIGALDRALADARVDPACLVFEVSETAAFSNIDQTTSFTTDLRNRGCRVTLDDFGFGVGSFHYLKHLPFHYFKIDGDFVRGCGADPTEGLVVEAMVGIARGLGTTTVVKSVTDQGMSDRLRRSGIDCAQGAYMGAPRSVLEAFG